MKKVLKSTIALLAMAMMLLTMTACSNDEKKDEKKDNEPEGEKIIATRSVKDSEEVVSMGGDYEESVEVKFVDGKFYKATFKFVCQKEETSRTIASMYSLAKMQYSGIKIDENGKEVSITFDEEAFSAILGQENLTKESVREYLKDAKYTIK